MKKILILIFVMSLPLISYSQNINGRFSSSLYTFERFDNANTSETYIRSFQSLYFNANKNDISIRTRLNFETNLSGSLESDPRLRFYNLYLEARNVFDIATLKIGRQPLYNSVAGGVFDGASVKAKLSGVTVSGYYGGNVPAYQKLELTDSWSEDYILGGKIELTAIENFRLSASYVDKNFKPVDYTALRLDENLDSVQVLIQKNSSQYKLISGEASYNLSGVFNINSTYEYDLNFNTTSKFEVSGRYDNIENVGISLYYNFREPKLRYNSIFSVFNFGNTQEIEGGIDYKISDKFTVVGKFANVTFEDEDSQRFTVGLNSNYGSVSYRKSMGYAGELDAVSVYTAHSMLDGMITPSIGLSYTTYKLSENEEAQNLTSFLGGVNYRPFNTWSFDLQGQYFNNKIYSSDFRLLFKINHWFNSNLEIL
ncbi:MAG: hypothetical protein KJ571_02885 [Bacteroidetes bacterium]|nr:hypothetical protein [Bacteroidota bacterium]